MINQSFENITQSGTTQTIEANVTGMNLTSPQFYCLLTCLTIIAIILIISITKVIQTLILRMNYITPLLIEKIKNEVLKELDK